MIPALASTQTWQRGDFPKTLTLYLSIGLTINMLYFLSEYTKTGASLSEASEQPSPSFAR